MISREAVYTALFALVQKLQSSGGEPTPTQPFMTVSREVIEVQNVAPGDQPVLFMDEAFEDYGDSGVALVPRKWTVYFHVGCTTEKGCAASTVLNPLIDAVEAALQPSMGDEMQNLGLGDFIQNVQLKGMAIKNLGNNSPDPMKRQAVCYLPVEITLP